MTSRVKKEFKSLDMFGQKVSLTFNKEGSTFNTQYGAITSIMIYLIVGLYSGQRFSVMLKKSESYVSSVSQPLNNLTDFGEVSITQTKMLFFISLYKTNSMKSYDI